ncbi:hypothetical protein ACHAXM_002140 [Skeletonema potamos]
MPITVIVPRQGSQVAAAAAPAPAPDEAAVLAPTTTTPSNASAAKRYHTILRDFMAYINHTESYPCQPYTEGHTFTDTELSAVTPEHVIRYFAYKLYGDGGVSASDKPLTGSHHTLDYYKKAISSFMPQRETVYDETTKKGNPTRAKEVNNYIRRIRDLEGDEGSSKKRKKSVSPVKGLKSPSKLPDSSTAKKARVVAQPTVHTVATNVGPMPNAIISSILQKMQLQNSLTIDFVTTLGTCIDHFRSTLQENNQSILTEIQRLNNSLQQPPYTYVSPAPVTRLPVAAGAVPPVNLPATLAVVPPAKLPATKTAVPPAPVPPAATAAVPGIAKVPQPAALVGPVNHAQWFYDHPDGTKRRVPPSWTFPSGTFLELYTLWHLGDPRNRIAPMKTFTSSDVSFCGNRSRMSLSEARCLATALDKEVEKAGRRSNPNMSEAELVELFRLGIKGLNIPLTTPTGRGRDIFRLKWSTFTKYKLGETNDEKEVTQLTHSPTPAVVQDESDWLYEHEDGSKRRVPSTWTFPMVGLEDMYVLWNCKDEKQKIMPMKTFTGLDVSFLQKGTKNLAEVRGMMTSISNEASKKGFQIKEVMTVPEARSAFSAGVGVLNIPQSTPQGKTRDIGRTKWSSASRYKQ